MENIEVGEYVRTKEGYIAKVKEISTRYYWFDNTVMKNSGIPVYGIKIDDVISIITKHFKNIFNLIESGDILKIKEGNLVCYISWNKEYDISLEEIQEKMKNKEIELLAIITKEQAKMIEYEVNK